MKPESVMGGSWMMIRFASSFPIALVYHPMRIGALSSLSRRVFWTRTQKLVLNWSIVSFPCCIVCNWAMASSLLPTSLKFSVRVGLNLQRVFPSLCRRYCSFQRRVFLLLKREGM